MAKSFTNSKEVPLKEGRHFTATVFGFTVIPTEAPVAYGLRFQQERCPKTQQVHLQLYFFTHANKTNVQASAWLTDFFKSKHVNAQPCKTREHVRHLYQSYVCKDATSVPGTSVTLNEGVIPEFVRVALPVWDRITYLICGPNHTGKTTWAEAECAAFAPDEAPHKVPPCANGQKGRWFGPYTGQRCVLIEEFQFGHFALDELKMIIDRKPQPVTTKAGGAADSSVINTAERIYLICNTKLSTVRQWLKHPQWEGRINVLKCMRKKYPPDPRKALRLEGCDDSTPDTYEDGSEWIEPTIPKKDSYEEKKTPKKRKRPIVLRPSDFENLPELK